MIPILNFICKKRLYQTKLHRIPAISTALTAIMAMTITTGSLSAGPKRKSLILAGPPASVSFPLAHIVATQKLKDVADKVEFKIWMNPDQLRTLALDGKTGFMAMPSNVAANLYNKDIAIQPINISAWGILYMLSRDKSRTSLKDYKNEEVVIPFRGDMPGILFQILASKQGLDYKKDFKIHYVSSPIDAMQLLLMRRARHVLLPEPAVSMALRKSGSFPLKMVAPDLFRSMSFQQEWGNVFQRSAKIPQAGIVAVGDAAKDAQLKLKIEQAYTESLNYCLKNTDACSKEIAPYFEQLLPEAIADSLQVSGLESVRIDNAKTELEYFFGKLFEANPQLIGGRMPDAGFYRW